MYVLVKTFVRADKKKLNQMQNRNEKNLHMRFDFKCVLTLAPFCISDPLYISFLTVSRMYRRRIALFPT
jgi:hypothetical protein